MLRIIATFIFIYLLFRILTTMIFPAIARWYLKRYKKRFYQNNPWAARAEENNSQKRQTNHQKSPKSKPDTDQLGEYVDFEEIKDNDHEN